METEKFVFCASQASSHRFAFSSKERQPRKRQDSKKLHAYNYFMLIYEAAYK